MKEITSIASIVDDDEASALPIRILYGTTTGNSEILAEETAEKLAEMDKAYKLSSTEDFNSNELYEVETLLLIMSTDGDGEPPLMAEDFYRFLNEKTNIDLHHLCYSVLALGDSSYPDFCQAGKDFDQMLEKLGAQRILKRVDCDYNYWNDFENWVGNVCSKVNKEYYNKLATI